MNLKWGRRNSPPSSSSFVSRPSLFSSWLSKFKKMVTSDPVPEPEAEPEHVHVKLKVNGKKKRRGVEGSVLNYATGGPMSSFRSSGSNGAREEESWRFSIKVKELTQEKKEKEIKTPRKGSMKFRRNMHRRVLEQELPKLDRELDEDHTHGTPDFLYTHKVSEQKLKKVELKTERRRKSYYVSRELEGRRTKQFSKVRVQSPRPPAKMEIRKVKARQDLKRTRPKIKEKTRKATSLESLAVVKRSFDPEKDFRESMMEMILEESINKPQELEELLACYLTLNDDECHDLIIKVFRQVWLDINKTCFQAEIHGEDGS